MLLLLSLALPLGTVAPPAAAQEALRIAAVVNDEAISVHDLAVRIALLLATTGQPNTPEARQRAAPHVLRMLIDEKLKMQEAKRLGVQVGREEIDQALTRIAAQIGVPPTDLPGLLASRGVTISALREQVEAEIAWVKAVSQSLQARRDISEEEVDARIERIAEDTGRPEFRVAEIYLPVDDPAAEAEIEALGRRIMEQLRQGVNFPALARNYSEGASAAVGGDLGWIRPDQLSPELQAAVRELSPGEVLGPIRAVTGYYIILLVDRRTSQGLNDGLDAAPTGRLVANGGAGDDAGTNGAVENDGSREDEAVDGESAADASGSMAVSPAARERVRRMLRNERLEAQARRMLRDLRREAFVDVRL